jgi:uncharacterized SAM-binding protein YcdF (DUF218 family)
MLFFQKTVTSIVELPGIIILLLSLFILFAGLKRKWKRLLILFTICLYLLSTSFFSEWFVAPLENWFTSSYSQQIQVDNSKTAIVVLSSSHRVGIPSGYDNVRADELEKTTLIRLNRGFELYQEWHIPIIVTGGVLWSSHRIPVAETMAQTLYRWGVPPDSVLLETRAMTTDQNAKYTLEILAPEITTLFLVTSAIHLPRAVFSFQTEAEKRSLSLRVIPIPTDFITENRDLIWLDFLPSNGAFTATTAAVHEWLGLLFYRLFKS